LVPQEIPEVISQLSTATVDNKDEITQSPVTVEKIVDILVRIADVSKSIVISEPVMKVCTLCMHEIHLSNCG